MIFMLSGLLEMKKKHSRHITHMRWQKALEFVEAGSRSPERTKKLHTDNFSVPKKVKEVVIKDKRDGTWHCHKILDLIVEQE